MYRPYAQLHPVAFVKFDAVDHAIGVTLTIDSEMKTDIFNTSLIHSSNNLAAGVYKRRVSLKTASRYDRAVTWS